MYLGKTSGKTSGFLSESILANEMEGRGLELELYDNGYNWNTKLNFIVPSLTSLGWRQLYVRNRFGEYKDTDSQTWSSTGLTLFYLHQ